MRVGAGQLKQLDEETLMFVAQLGATGIQPITPELPGEKPLEYADPLRHRQQGGARAHRFRGVQAAV